MNCRPYFRPSEKEKAPKYFIISIFGAYFEVSGEQVKSAQPARMTIPVKAVVNNEQLTGVYVVSKENKALLRWVRLGKQMGDRIEVLSGLAPDERFVVSTEGRIYNGSKVIESK